MSKIFRSGIEKINDGSIDWDTDTIKVILCKTGIFGTMDANTHNFMDDIPAAFRAGSVDKTKAITAQIDTATAGTVYLKASASSVTFPTVSADTMEGIVVYKSRTTEAASEIICLLTFSTNQASNGGEFTVNFNANGIIQYSFTQHD